MLCVEYLMLVDGMNVGGSLMKGVSDAGKGKPWDRSRTWSSRE